LLKPLSLLIVKPKLIERAKGRAIPGRRVSFALTSLSPSPSTSTSVEPKIFSLFDFTIPL